MNFLITPTDVLEFEDISINVKDKRINIDIRQAHELDFKSFLGAAFYYDVMSGIKFTDGVYDSASTGQKYKDLYEGKEYTDKKGHSIVYDGLKPMLVYFAFARFTKMDKYRFTATGPVAKRHESSDGLSQKEIIMLTEQARSVANAYANDVDKFLNDNNGDYPLWKFNYKQRESRQPGPRIRSVDRTDFNLRSNRNLNNRFGLDNFLDD